MRFNGPPEEHPVRILIATDAAREGVNLQGHCADLFHFDIPWNPARMEQRNGRIDRTLQPSRGPLPLLLLRRREDAVLRKLVAKVETIQTELGSLERADGPARRRDGRGHRRSTPGDLDAAEAAKGRKETAKQELEASEAQGTSSARAIEDDGRVPSVRASSSPSTPLS